MFQATNNCSQLLQCVNLHMSPTAWGCACHLPEERKLDPPPDSERDQAKPDAFDKIYNECEHKAPAEGINDITKTLLALGLAYKAVKVPTPIIGVPSANRSGTMLQPHQVHKTLADIVNMGRSPA